jgi:predicted transcriptional regulator
VINKNNWVNKSLSGYSKLFEPNSSWMAISLIATFNLKTCDIEDSLAQVLNQKELEEFDYIPVRFKRKIVGVLNAKNLRDCQDTIDLVNLTIGKTDEPIFKKLDESILISINADIISFLKESDSVNFRLVLDGTEINGIVTVSDLQKLAVRSVLYSLLNYLEMLMAELIRKKFPIDDDWESKLDVAKRKKIQKQWTKLINSNMAIDKLTATELSDKILLAKELAVFSDDYSEISGKLNDIRNLRNSANHMHDYASNFENANKVSKVVRDILQIIDKLEKAV